MTSPVKLQLSYSFTDDKMHSMNAFVRNDNEKEILAILKEVMAVFDIQFEVESEAVAEGSLITKWRLFGKNEKQIMMIAKIVGFLIVSLPTAYYGVEYTKVATKKLEQEIITERQVQEKNDLEIIKLKKELNQPDGELTETTIEQAVKVLENNPQINFHKSNVYKKLNTVEEVTQVTTVIIDKENRPASQERVITKNQFNTLIISTNQLEPEEDEEAIIEIVAPVLRAGNYQWKGIYKDEPINFFMLDETFKGEVLRGDHSFSSGVSIKCVLDRRRKIDDNGRITITKNNVVVVLEVLKDGKPPIITEHGKAHQRRKKEIASQMNIAFKTPRIEMKKITEVKKLPGSNQNKKK